MCYDLQETAILIKSTRLYVNKNATPDSFYIYQSMLLTMASCALAKPIFYAKRNETKPERITKGKKPV